MEMNKEDFKGTKGKATFHSYGKGSSGRYRFAIQVSVTTVCRILRDDNDNSDQEHANVSLICEAFNVATRTGLTPSQLHAELEKAKELIAGCVKELDAAGGSENEWTTRMSKRLTTFLNEGKK